MTNSIDNTLSASVHLRSEHETRQFAEFFATLLSAPLIIGFEGDIGAGKTTMIRAMLRGLGVAHAIKSPTFSIVESYELPSFDLHHFDLYRIHHEDELDYIGFREYFALNTICCIEWPCHAGRLLPIMDIVCKINSQGLERALTIDANTGRGAAILTKIASNS
jgi:tRNA threonylcarbamoyladenosine biosynthesis protein TsaE